MQSCDKHCRQGETFSLPIARFMAKVPLTKHRLVQEKTNKCLVLHDLEAFIGNEDPKK